MSIRRKAFLASALLSAALVGWFLVLPMFQYSAARKKFPLGMTLEEAQKFAQQPYRVINGEGAVVFPAGAPSEIEKQQYHLTEMYCDREGALLLFNYYNKLIEIRPTRSLVDLVIWKHTRGW